MDYKKVVSTAIKEVEKESQEKQIKKVKQIVKGYLEKIAKKEIGLKEISQEIKELKRDLDDLKAGRLDKIEDKQGKDKIHDKFTLIIIKKVEKEYIPLQPWRSPWIVTWRDNYIPNIPFTTTTDNTEYVTLTADDMIQTTSTGTTFQNFTIGTYEVNGKIINL